MITQPRPFTLRARARTRALRAIAAAALLAGGVLAARPAAAQVLVRRGTVRPAYPLELEPHLIFGAAPPPGPGSGQGAGIGVRGSFVLAPQGFIASLDDTVSLGVGLDLLRYDGGGSQFGRCTRFTPGPAGTNVCTEVSGPGSNYAFVPVVMQWSFWLTPMWSVFAEPGVAVFVASGGSGVAPSFSVGGRVRLSQAIALTLRLGWPTLTFGGSFFL